MKLDDYTLAAYLSGEMTGEKRQTVATALVTDADAREVLHMACEALAAGFEHTSVREHLQDRAARAPARPGRSIADRPGVMHARPQRGQA